MKNKDKDIREIGYEHKTGDYSVSRSKRFDWVILIVCILVAFFIWAYALNITDPIVEKEVNVYYNFEGFELGETKVEFYSVLVYGPSSVLESVDAIEINVNKSEFYNKTEIDKKIKYPSRINPVDEENKTVHIRLVEN